MPSPEVSQPIDFAEKIKQYLRDATEQRVQQFAVEVQCLIQVKNYLEQHLDDRESTRDWCKS